MSTHTARAQYAHHVSATRDAMHDLMTGGDPRISESARDMIERWIMELDDARYGGIVSLRAWMQARNGSNVETLQVRAAVPYAGLEYGIRGIWAPAARSVAAGASYVRLGDSRRDYAGVHAVAATERAWVGWDNDADTLIVYRVSDA